MDGRLESITILNRPRLDGVLRRLASEVAELGGDSRVETLASLAIATLGGPDPAPAAARLHAAQFLPFYRLFAEQCLATRLPSTAQAQASALRLTQTLALLLLHCPAARLEFLQGPAPVAAVLLGTLERPELRGPWGRALAEACLYSLWAGGAGLGRAAAVVGRFLGSESEVLRLNAALLLGVSAGSSGDGAEAAVEAAEELLNQTAVYRHSFAGKEQVQVIASPDSCLRSFPVASVLQALLSILQRWPHAAATLGASEKVLDVLAALIAQKALRSNAVQALATLAHHDLPAARMAQHGTLQSALRNRKGTDWTPGDCLLCEGILLATQAVNKGNGKAAKEGVAAILAGPGTASALAAALKRILAERGWSAILVGAETTAEELRRVGDARLSLALLDAGLLRSQACLLAWAWQCRRRLPFIPLLVDPHFRPPADMAAVLRNFAPLPLPGPGALDAVKEEILRRCPPLERL